MVVFRGCSAAFASANCLRTDTRSRSGFVGVCAVVLIVFYFFGQKELYSMGDDGVDSESATVQEIEEKLAEAAFFYGIYLEHSLSIFRIKPVTH